MIPTVSSHRVVGLVSRGIAILALILASFACQNSAPDATAPEAQATPTAEAKSNSIILTHEQPAASAAGELTAPGYEKQNYTVFFLDTTDFSEGGTLIIEVQLGDGESDGSFDLFPQDVPIPTEGRAEDSLAALYDLKRGERGTMRYQFPSGQVFQFGATGNWFSREGATNTFTLTIRVESSSGAMMPAVPPEELLAQRPFKPTDTALFFPTVYQSDLPFVDAVGDPPSEDQARAMLEDYLRTRYPNDPDKVNEGILLYNDPGTFLKISSPSLRAAFVALRDTVGEPAMNFILHARTSAGNPKVVLVRFSKFPENRTNTIGMAHVGEFDDREQMTIEINERFQSEHPLLFTNTLAHEALHNDDTNSIVEEEVLSALDTLVHLELLAYYPQLADSGTWLSRWMNTNTLSRLNSGSGSELGLYDSNGNQPIWPGGEKDTNNFDARFVDNPGRDSSTAGSDVLKQCLERLHEDGNELPAEINFSVDLLHWISDNQAELTPEELVAAALALKLELPKSSAAAR